MSEERTGPHGIIAREFLTALEAEPNVTAACERVGLSRTQAYHWRRTDEAFAGLWDAAYDRGWDAFEDACKARAQTGVVKFVVSSGRLVVGPDGKPLTERVYSDGLAMFMLKSHRPERYRDRSSVDLNVQGDLAGAIEAGRKRAREGKE